MIAKMLTIRVETRFRQAHVGQEAILFTGQMPDGHA